MSETCPGCGNLFGGDNLCMPCACQWEGVERPKPATSTEGKAGNGECPECGHAVERHDQDGCLMFVVEHDGEAACPCWVGRSQPAAPDIARMARDLHLLIRNGKDIPYADSEEQRYYEHVVIRWVERYRLDLLIAEVTADDYQAPPICGDVTGPNGVGGPCVLPPGHPHADGIEGVWPAGPCCSEASGSPEEMLREIFTDPPPGATEGQAGSGEPLVENDSPCEWGGTDRHRWGTGRDRDECAECDAPRWIRAAQPPAPADDAAEVLAGLVEEIERNAIESRNSTSDLFGAARARGMYDAIALVEAAQQRLADRGQSEGSG